MIDLTEKRSRRFIVTLMIIFLLVLKVDALNSFFGIFFKVTAPFLIGIGIAFLLNKPMQWFEWIYEKIGLKNMKVVRGLAIVTTYISFFFILNLFVGIIVPGLLQSVTNFMENSDEYFRNLSILLSDIEQKVSFMDVELDEITVFLKNLTTRGFSIVAPVLMNITKNVLSSVFTFIVALIFSIYVLVSKEDISTGVNRFLRAYTPESVHRKFIYVGKITANVFNNFVSGQVMDAFVIGMMCFVGMTIFKFEYALLISTVIGVTALIPMFGAFVGGGFGVLLLLMISPKSAFLFLIFLIIIQQIDSNLIYPMIVGSSMGLPPMLVMVAVLVGGSLFGFVGMLLGVPVLTVFYTILSVDIQFKEKKRNIQSTEDIEKMLGITSEFENILVSRHPEPKKDAQQSPKKKNNPTKSKKKKKK